MARYNKTQKITSKADISSLQEQNSVAADTITSPRTLLSHCQGCSSDSLDCNSCATDRAHVISFDDKTIYDTKTEDSNPVSAEHVGHSVNVGGIKRNGEEIFSGAAAAGCKHDPEAVSGFTGTSDDDSYLPDYITKFILADRQKGAEQASAVTSDTAITSDMTIDTVKTSEMHFGVGTFERTSDAATTSEMACDAATTSEMASATGSTSGMSSAAVTISGMTPAITPVSHPQDLPVGMSKKTEPRVCRKTMHSRKNIAKNEGTKEGCDPSPFSNTQNGFGIGRDTYKTPDSRKDRKWKIDTWRQKWGMDGPKR